ncbi:hypothetical protein [Streptomyces exfoliatus]
MTNDLIYADSCPLCSRPLRPEFRRSRPSAQQAGPALVWFDRYPLR